MGDKTATVAPAGKAPERAGRPLAQKAPNSVLGLQQSLGNQAMLRLLKSGVIQAKLRVSQPGDPDEIEADHVAEKVVSAQTAPAIQRKCACGGGAPCAKCAEEEESIHRSVADTIHRQSQPSIQRLATDQAPGQEIHPQDSSAAQSPARQKSSPSLIVEDEAGAAAPGQMKKSQFMQHLRSSVCATADAALAAVGRNSKSCPYIEQWLSFYSGQGADRIERALHKYAPEAARAKRAQDYISIVSDRVRQAVTVWARTGRVTGVPAGAPFLPGASSEDGVEAPPAAGTAGAGSKPSGASASPLAAGQSILAKSRDSGAAASTADHGAVRERLGAGRPLDTSVRSRMEPAFGQDFSHVLLHTDSTAAQLSTELNARAFTIGESIAFASGEYKPGTLAGDALMAHELAHAVQQGDAAVAAPSRNMEQDKGLEENADNMAVNAVASIFTSGKAAPGRMGARSVPAIKSGLRLQRCQRHLKKCPSNRHWAVVGPPAGGGSFGCLCRWECVSGPPPRPVPASSGPSISCPPDRYCAGPPPVDEVGEDYQQVGDGKLGYGVQSMQGDPMTGEAVCSCFTPDDLVGAETPPPIKTGFDPSNFYAGPMPGDRGGTHEARPAEGPAEVRHLEEGKGDPPPPPRTEVHPPTETKPAPQVKAPDVQPETKAPEGKPEANAPPGKPPEKEPSNAIVDTRRAGGAKPQEPPRVIEQQTPEDQTIKAGEKTETQNEASGQRSNTSASKSTTQAPTTNTPPPTTRVQPGGPTPPQGGPGVKVVTVTGSTVVVDTNIARALDKAAKDPSLATLQPGEKAMVAYAKGLGVAVTSESIGELGKKGGVGATLSGTQEVTLPPVEREAIKNEVSRVVGGAGDREVVTQALLAKADPGVTPVFATADRGVINGLARLDTSPAPIPVAKLGRYRTVAEFLHYEQKTDSFTINIRGHSMIVRPVQEVRPGL
jgi:Domain of unknown function (DUF4157)